MRRQSAAWFTLALAALGLSAVFAVILVVARTPFLGQGAGLFRTALVLHVDLAVHVWFLAMAAGLWSFMAPASPLRWGAFALALAGTLAMIVTPLTGTATPILANYVPLLDSPVFLIGLCLFAAGIGLVGLQALNGSEIAAPWQLAARFAAFAMLATLLVLGVDLLAATDPDAGTIGVEDRLWGVGHGIQFVHILLLMGAWCSLGADAITRMPALRRALPWLFFLTLVPALMAPAIAVMHPLGSSGYRDNFTFLMRWTTWPGAALLGLFLTVGLIRLKRERQLSEEEIGLMLSLFLFGIGCLLGATIRGESLAVPAHYHGTVGAITLAYLLWLRRLAPDFGIADDDVSKTGRLALLYGAGILVLIAGLAAAGGLGIPRKAAHVDLSADTLAYFATMGTAGVGGFIALSAIAAIAAIGLRAIWRARIRTATISETVKPLRRDVRLWTISVTLLLVAVGGWLLERVPGTQTSSFAPGQHAKDKTRADIELRFQQGVIMLHAKQYDHALAAFHRVMQLAPEMPEAYVNTGFALLGMKRYPAARDFFESATLLRRNQINAYYGLALALQGMGDYQSALGAMQTFVHLSKADDPFRLKAETTIQEWRKALAIQAQKNGPSR